MTSYEHFINAIERKEKLKENAPMLKLQTWQNTYIICWVK